VLAKNPLVARNAGPRVLDLREQLPPRGGDALRFRRHRRRRDVGRVDLIIPIAEATYPLLTPRRYGARLARQQCAAQQLESPLRAPGFAQRLLGIRDRR
jgi:hypothetical protein